MFTDLLNSKILIRNREICNHVRGDGISVNLALCQSGQQSAPLPSLYVS